MASVSSPDATSGRRIVLGVTGGIAAYKAADLTSKLVQAGAIVDVILTAGAQQFIQPLTFNALTRRPVHGDVAAAWDETQAGHVTLAAEADLLLPYLLAYWAAARGLSLLVRGPMARRVLVRRAMAVGERMYLSGEITRKESLARPTIESALRAFEDQGYLRDDGGKLSLVPPFDTTETVGVIESKLRELFPREAP